jgi:hypothetical protein
VVRCITLLESSEAISSLESQPLGRKRSSRRACARSENENEDGYNLHHHEEPHISSYSFSKMEKYEGKSHMQRSSEDIVWPRLRPRARTRNSTVQPAASSPGLSCVAYPDGYL